MSAILDASAILALLLKEPGSEMVATWLAEAAISSVNMAEVYSKCADRGLDPSDVKGLFAGLGVEVLSFSDRHAMVTGQLRAQTRSQGLSLGDRACLATGMVEKRRVITADRVWLTLGLDIEITSIR
jgi:PIN domain nuclease of toxin-antitoxin system